MRKSFYAHSFNGFWVTFILSFYDFTDGLDINAWTFYFESLIHLLIIPFHSTPTANVAGSAAVAKALIDKKADVNKKDKSETTALMVGNNWLLF